MEITQYYMKQNPCFVQGKSMIARGVVVHSSGCDNPNLARYIGPDDGVLGPNRYDNHWNRPTANKCVHAFIGKDRTGTVRCYQTLPWTVACWGCGGGKRGSYNADRIQFEILEDSGRDEAYFRAAFTLAAELVADLCTRFGFALSQVVGHYEAHALGYASDHSDPRTWFSRFGESMDSFRDAVSRAMGRPVKLGERLVHTPGDTLNVRADPVWTAKKLGELPHRSPVETLGAASNGWMKVRQGTLTGWVNGSFLTALPPASGTARVSTPGDTLNVRTEAGYPSLCLGALPDGTDVQTRERAKNGWVLVSGGGLTGWVNGRYLKKVTA